MAAATAATCDRTLRYELQQAGAFGTAPPDPLPPLPEEAFSAVPLPTPAATQAEAQPCMPGAWYAYRVRAGNAEGWSGWSGAAAAAAAAALGPAV